MSSRQDLGVELAALPAELFSRLQVGDELLVALTESRRLRANEAKRRQLQFIGKIMRHMDDDEFERVSAHFFALTDGKRLDNRLLHQAEGWRDALLSHDDAAKTELERLPALHAKAALESLAQAQNEAKNGVYGQHTRLLFRHIRQGLELLAKPPESDE
jgi:ribosome-associated protein